MELLVEYCPSEFTEFISKSQDTLARNVPCKEHDSKADGVQKQEPQPHIDTADDTQPSRSAAKVGKSVVVTYLLDVFSYIANITWLRDNTPIVETIIYHVAS